MRRGHGWRCVVGDLRRSAESVGADVRIYYLDVSLGELAPLQVRIDDSSNSNFEVGYDELATWADAIDQPMPGDDAVVIMSPSEAGRKALRIARIRL